MIKILLVEDSASMRSHLVNIIETDRDDIEIVEAENGFEALKTLPHHKFDAILTDINMPDINGLELIRFVRQAQHLAAVALLVISTQSSERDRARSLALGADEFLAKPFAPEQLVSAVSKSLAARRDGGHLSVDEASEPKPPRESGV
jgi:two-component system, chemotaxis family, chemotaxis protein CheY